MLMKGPFIDYLINFKNRQIFLRAKHVTFGLSETR
jgi:hypothetical protein